jgi:hypothetical protein
MRIFRCIRLNHALCLSKTNSIILIRQLEGSTLKLFAVSNGERPRRDSKCDRLNNLI